MISIMFSLLHQDVYKVHGNRILKSWNHDFKIQFICLLKSSIWCGNMVNEWVTGWEFRKGGVVVGRVWVLELERTEFQCKFGYLLPVIFYFLYITSLENPSFSSWIDPIGSKLAVITQIHTRVKKMIKEWSETRKQKCRYDDNKQQLTLEYNVGGTGPASCDNLQGACSL